MSFDNSYTAAPGNEIGRRRQQQVRSTNTPQQQQKKKKIKKGRDLHYDTSVLQWYH